MVKFVYVIIHYDAYYIVFEFDYWAMKLFFRSQFCDQSFFWSLQWQQMDVEYTFWQMLNLCTSPKVV